jgi:hypothetical protein
LYGWREVDEIPASSGIYAWYYRHTLTDFDINQLITDLTKMAQAPPEEREGRVRKFLLTFLFDVFREEPYEVDVTGPLKPRYRGKVDHVSTVTLGLIQRIAGDPKRLWVIKKVLEEAVPEFAAPIYIGMADDLRARTQRHKRLIQYYKSQEDRDAWEPTTAEEEAEHSFARDVVRRRFNLARLEVAVRLIDMQGDVHLDAENILNRINFPLCGRN